MFRFKVVELGKLFDSSVTAYTAFNHVATNPRKYCYDDLAKFIEQTPDEYVQMIRDMRLDGGYSQHLRGTHIMRELFKLGLDEKFLTKHIVYPKTYQFRTHMPFLDIKTIKASSFPTYQFCPSPVMDGYVGYQVLSQSPSSLPVIRYGVPGGEQNTERRPRACAAHSIIPRLGVMLCCSSSHN